MEEPSDVLSSMLQNVIKQERVAQPDARQNAVDRPELQVAKAGEGSHAEDLWICPSCLRSIDGKSRPERCPECGATLAAAADATVAHDAARRAASTVAEPAPELARTIGRYQILRELGRGGFGTVYLARDPNLNQRVAVKVPKAGKTQSAQFVERFEREGRNGAKLRKHPGIVTVYDVGCHEGVPYLVFEFVAGEPLHERLAPSRWSQERPPFEEIAQLIAQLARALEYAHSNGVIHRDVKPSNIMIGQDGRPKLMDFGLAKQDDVDITVTHDGAIVGTPAYMSPQQAAGRHEELTPQTDVYSLGVVLYQMLTGEIPFRGRSQEVLRQVREDEPAAPSKLNAKVPWELEAICQKAMEKELRQRYATAGEFADDLERWLRGEPIKARQIGTAGRTWRWCRRNPVTSGLLALIAVLLVALTIGSGAMYAVELKARIAEATARQKVEEALDKDRQLLASAYVEKGAGYLHTGRPIPESGPLRSLPWLEAALKLDVGNPERKRSARIRMQTALDFAPRVERMWFHQGRIAAAGIGPKKDVFFVAGEDGKVELYRMANPRAPFAILVHAQPVDAAAFNGDETLFATGSTDGGIRIWDVATGGTKNSPLRQMAAGKKRFPQNKARNPEGRKPISQYTFTSIRFSAGGRLLASAEIEVGTQIWDVASGAAIGGPIGGVNSRATDFEFADADQLLVSVHFDGTVRVTDIKTGSTKPSTSDTKRVGAAAITGVDGVTIAGATADGKVLLWDGKTGKALGEPLVHDRPVIDLRFSPDGRLLVTATSNGTFKMWHMKDGRLLWTRRLFSEFSRPYDRLEFSADGATLAAVNNQKGIVVLDGQNGQLIAQPITMAIPLSFAGWADAGRILAMSEDGAVRLWSLESNERAFALPHPKGIQTAVVSDDRKTVATIDGSGTCCVVRANKEWEFDAAGVTSFAIGHATEVAALSRDGSKLAVSNTEQIGAAVSVFDASNHRLLFAPLPLSAGAVAMRMTSDGRRLVCATRDRKITVWDLAKGTELGTATLNIQGRARSLDIDGDDKRCAVAIGKQIVVLDLANLQPVGPALSGDLVMQACRFFKDPRFVLGGCMDGEAYIFEAASGRLIGATAKRPREILFVDIVADGSLFLTGSRDGTARLWSSADAAPVSPVLEHATNWEENNAALYQGAVDPSGRFVATVTGPANGAAKTEFEMHGWDAATGRILFVRSMRHLLSRFPRHGDPSSEPSRIALVFFSPDSRYLHALTMSGLLVSVNFDPPERPAAEIHSEVAIRSGFEFDAAGGLRVFDPRELAAIWRTPNSHR